MKVEAFDDNANRCCVKGELVCTASALPCPFTSGTIPTGRNTAGAYFELRQRASGSRRYIEIHPKQPASSSTGVRADPIRTAIGFSRARSTAGGKHPRVLDSLVVAGLWTTRWVVLSSSFAAVVSRDDSWLKRIKTMIAQNTTPRHVPGRIIAVQDIPYTISGKRSNWAVRKVHFTIRK